MNRFIKALFVTAPQVVIIETRLLGGTINFIGNPTFTSWIPTNVMEQTTTGALFPGTAAALIDRQHSIGDKVVEVVYKRTGIRIPGSSYLNYAIPAVGGTLFWDGLMTGLRYLGVEGAERPGLIPFDAAVALTVSTAYAWMIDNPRKLGSVVYNLGNFVYSLGRELLKR